MVLIDLTVVVIAFLIAALAIFLLMIGGLLNRTANNLDDGLQSMRTIIGHSGTIRPGVARINKTGGELADAVPLLLDDVDQIVAKTASAAPNSAPASAPTSVPAATTAPESSVATTADPATATPEAAPTGVGYMDV